MQFSESEPTRSVGAAHGRMPWHTRSATKFAKEIVVYSHMPVGGPGRCERAARDAAQERFESRFAWPSTHPVVSCAAGT